MDNNRVKYVVIPEKGIVKAYIENCELDIFGIVNSRFIPTATSGLRLIIMLGNERAKYMKYQMRPYYSAVARCHPNDTFNEETGKAIALAKLSEKYHASLNKRLAKISAALHKAMFNIDDYLAKRE